MRFIFADPGLSQNLGHHANACRQIVAAAGRRGLSSVVLAHQNIDPPLAEELNAVPLFRRGTYDRLRSLKLKSLWTKSSRMNLRRSTRWLRFGKKPSLGVLRKLDSFERAVQSTADDLAGFDFSSRDIIYFNSAQVVELAAVLRFLVSLPVRNRPTVFVEFFLPPGVTVHLENKEILTITEQNAFHDPRAALYRMVGAYWSGLTDPLPLQCITLDQYVSRVFAELIGRAVATFPLPRLSITNRRSRVGSQPPTLGIIGHQRLDKGYHLVPEIIRHVLASRPSIRFLIHNGAPHEMEQIQNELRAMAEQDPRLKLDERSADHVAWKELLEQCDLIVCPYEANHFRSCYSAVAAEAAADAIPAVVPADTSLSAMIAGLDGGYTTFEAWDARSIAQATIEAIDRLDELAERANATAARWPMEHGPDRLIEAILSKVNSEPSEF